MLIKIWELETQHCIQTLIGSRNEIWALAKNPQETRIVAGSIDNELRVWNLEPLLEDDEVLIYIPINSFVRMVRDAGTIEIPFIWDQYNVVKKIEY